MTILFADDIDFFLITSPSEPLACVKDSSSASVDRTTNMLAIVANKVVTSLYGQTIVIKQHSQIDFLISFRKLSWLSTLV